MGQLKVLQINVRSIWARKDIPEHYIKKKHYRRSFNNRNMVKG